MKRFWAGLFIYLVFGCAPTLRSKPYGFESSASSTISNSENPVLDTVSGTLASSVYINCILRSDGKVFCLGNDTYYELGNGLAQGGYSATPQEVAIDEVVTQISSGLNHACALLENGTVKCWGDNSAGQVGDSGNLSPHSTPYLVPGITDIQKLALGANYSCALNSIGQVYCWGDNQQGQIGSGSNDQNVLVPTLVSGLNNVIDLASGSSAYTTCAVHSNGLTSCWGMGTFGNFGDLSSDSSNVPVQVPSIENAFSIAVGYFGACVILESTEVACWGSNSNAWILGVGQNLTVGPTAIPELTGSKKIWLGYFGCAIDDSDDLYCWGINGYGQLGLGHVQLVSQPTLVMANVIDVSVADSSTCARTSDDDVYCWGANPFGNLGNLNMNFVYDEIIDLDLDDLVVEEVKASTDHSCLRTADGSLMCWGSNSSGQFGNGTYDSSYTPVPVQITGVSEIELGAQHTCALKAGEVYCWGASNYGANGSSVSLSTPTKIDGLSGVTKIRAGFYVTCALKGEFGNPLWCWGQNDNYQLANGTTASSETAVQNLGISQVLDVAIGYAHMCAIRDNQTLECWGSNEFGQLGRGDYMSLQGPGTVSGISDIVKVQAGYYFTCALNEGQELYCWGRNGDYGAVGSDALSPTLILTDVLDFSSSWSSTCAIKTDGHVYCFGNNNYGHFGDGSFFQTSYTPTVSTLWADISQISVGNYHSCAIRSDGTAGCLGNNGYGQLGGYLEQLSPMSILLPEI